MGAHTRAARLPRLNEDRFHFLETSPVLPASVQSAISRLDRFDHLEIAHLSEPLVFSPAASAPASDRILCPFCHQANERARDVCWACFKPLHSETLRPNQPGPDQPIQLLLDGVTYVSTDPSLPADIQALIARIRVQGFSQELLSEWRAWRKGTIDPVSPVALRPGADPDPQAQAFRGTRVSVLRLDGVLYKSDDTNLPSDIRDILEYIQQEGVTPMLMQHLRLYGTRVKFRPLSKVYPSDGDVNFWNAAKKTIEKPRD